MTTPFDKIGPSRRDLVHAGLAKFPPLEVGTLITFEQIAEWIGEPFPLIRFRPDGVGTLSYEPMDDVKSDLLDAGIVLVAVDNVASPADTALRCAVMDMTAQQKEWMGVDDVARTLGVAPLAVYALVRRNHIPHYRVGRRIRFVPSLVDEWRRNGGTAAKEPQ